jgi:signal peptidase I
MDRLKELIDRLREFVKPSVTVEGTSMAPTYLPGERITALRKWRPVRKGDVVLLRDPRDVNRWLLKRCVERVGRQLDLRGDNVEASADSREFGLVDVRDVVYIVLPQSAH